jgi:thiol-disulfide isomerase/thioredoxin
MPTLLEAAGVPHLDERGQADYAAYRQAPSHRAFAIAPGGTWGWQADLPSAALAQQGALQACQQYTEQRCVLYDSDGRIVFDAKTWPHAWGPYLGAKQAAQASVGMRRGDRFPDLRFQSPSGREGKLSDLRGKVVVLHFWGSWCPPCQREMPELRRIYAEFRKSKDVVFVLLPVREPLDVSRKWLKQKGGDLPLAFGGEATIRSGEFRLADGGRLTDRDMAKAFPTTYVLDKQGIVVFSRIGPVARWPEYAPFLRDVASRSGR